MIRHHEPLPPRRPHRPVVREELDPLPWLAAACLILLVAAIPYQVHHGSFVHVGQWGTIVFALIIQALPLVAVGSAVSAAVAVYVPESYLPRSVPGAALAGLLLPTCECASVPVARRLMDRGLPAGAAFAFMMAAPAINPLVLVSTYLAYQATPMMVVARFTGGLLAACIVGWAWAFLPSPEQSCAHTHRVSFRDAFSQDMVNTVTYLVIGCSVAGAVKVTVPADSVTWASPLVAIGVLMLLAVVMSICSEADAFVAASFTAAPLSAQLAFMLIGPMLDVKLVALQWGAFGPKTALRLAGVAVLATLAALGLVSWIF